MGNSKFGVLLSTKKFTQDDQLAFARLSGDFNPIHIDNVFSRKTLFGQIIVHGIHSAMWAIDSLIHNNGTTPSSCKCIFKKPIFLEEGIASYWDDTKNKLTIAVGEIELTTITVDFSEAPLEFSDQVIQDLSSTDQHNPLPESLLPDDCIKFKKLHAFTNTGRSSLAKLLFPFLYETYGANLTLEFAATSEVVGMHCPGLHSLFSSIDVVFKEMANKSHFYLTNFDQRFNKVSIAVHGRSLSASLDAFFRPPPSGGESFSDISKMVDANEFRNVNALIIGGSRGIGAVTAQIICAGGGRVTVTYHSGINDAINICSEIQSNGGQCNYIHYSVLSTPSSMDLIEPINQVYYFASPKIIGESFRRGNLDLDGLYRKYFIDGFVETCELLTLHNPGCSVFYPSTSFIEEGSKEFKSYIDAKIIGEKICTEFNQKNSIRILSVRLPKLPSDQNQSIFPVKLPKISNTILPVIRNMMQLTF